MKIYLISCLGLDFDIDLLPHFIEHYLKLGIQKENFLLVLNYFKYPQKLHSAQRTLSHYGIKPLKIWRGEYDSKQKWKYINELLCKYVNEKDWAIHPDFDEFHEYPDSIRNVIEDFEINKINAIQGFLIDRISIDKKIKKITDEPIFSQFPIKTSLHNLMEIRGVKLMMYKGYLRANRGSGQVHRIYSNIVKYPYGNRPLQRLDRVKKVMYRPKRSEDFFIPKMEDIFSIGIHFYVHHFKWTENVIEKLNNRIKRYKELDLNWWIESQNFLDYYEKYGIIKT